MTKYLHCFQNFLNKQFYFRDDGSDVLCIAEWNGTLSFYTNLGVLIGRERTLNFIPLKISYFPEGQYILVVGSNKQCLLLTSDGIQLMTVGAPYSSWVWSCAVHPTSPFIVIHFLLKIKKILKRNIIFKLSTIQFYQSISKIQKYIRIHKKKI